jgi:hypothetical protein
MGPDPNRLTHASPPCPEPSTSQLELFPIRPAGPPSHARVLSRIGLGALASHDRALPPQSQTARPATTKALRSICLDTAPPQPSPFPVRPDS